MARDGADDTKDGLRAVCYHMSHDLRAPLRAIQGFAFELLEQYGEVLPGPGRDLLRRTSDASLRIEVLLWKLEEYGQWCCRELDLTWVKLERVLNTVLYDMRGEIKRRRAMIKVQPPLPQLWTSAVMLDQILKNVLRNAISYVQLGTTPEVRIWAEEDETGPQIYVKDNGIGIAPEDQERIFWIFDRSPKSVRHTGTGIGLAVVRKGMQRLGGRVKVESELGAGSSFILEWTKSLGGPYDARKNHPAG